MVFDEGVMAYGYFLFTWASEGGAFDGGLLRRRTVLPFAPVIFVRGRLKRDKKKRRWTAHRRGRRPDAQITTAKTAKSKIRESSNFTSSRNLLPLLFFTKLNQQR